ncbi:bifunctional UDP-N-acetylmuramoyl-L-alanyl-D-glutamate--2,6-diaminopimelate ligase MurE/UDP-N-acetylmuramoyl-tripeptide--D-alanyl-D-alanine ligase MurF [Neopusillimonas maritima]|uniref:Multifunctional fusion protein n=1 Tax=Neopusillimonas maritima TaxID=2026239 RepID=A0ABX9MWK5_9BURK|nr:bifunctional UDP-N-acetylmuramoyl-L-alanyl-D-glutamate--2,6-diaminopimelate ligase MurE/UDP-N-acetylmuramoyl-tripeptide--D-alanyl-D-alanine ligase MurF [Neopusillimonas maritima]RII82941.1 UDP-N-acetylmuramoyl-L-alanyl-D-glutamate--2,6-diaminopimelate ligase [Neopusillimonas maritima]
MTANQVLNWLKEHVDPQSDLCLDSRQVSSGDVFFACPGYEGDGRDYIAQAVAKGASAVVTEPLSGIGVAASISVPVLEVESLRQLLGQVAHEWYGRVSMMMSVIAITGTNGKTSTVHWIAQALNDAGIPCGTIGTLGVALPDGTLLEGRLTTPDVLSVHQALATIYRSGARSVALEASSIGLDQGRLDGVEITIAGFTNLSHDHLDYHGSLDKYETAKLTLFNRQSVRQVVTNFDDVVGRKVPAAAHRGIQVLGYSTGVYEGAAVRAGEIHAGSHGLVFNLELPDGAAQIVTRLVGQHTVSNLLLVAGVLHFLGWSVVKVGRALGQLTSVPGRMDVVESIGGSVEPVRQPMVVVDYAHTPDALERALEALRGLAEARGGRLHCVFGCGGNRDRGKREMMGEIAGRLADRVVLTSDNPRGESPQAILEDIVVGLSGLDYQIVVDRSEAILQTVWSAAAEDVVLLAGKGHETYQEIHGERLPFDDREWARAALLLVTEPTLSTDTRTLASDQVFIALKGDRFDGHHYLDTALEANAIAAIVESRVKSCALTQIALGDTRQALQTLGRVWRKRFDIPLVAVTGSNGKTTTKEMIASIFRAWQGDKMLSTEGNFNNDLGVPLTLLRLRHQHRIAVLELGMNHPGEIRLLAGMASPTVGLVNNAQREHQEFMHTVEAVARENGSVLQMLSPEGVAVFPGDDEYTELWKKLSDARRCVLFGSAEGMDVGAEYIQAKPSQTVFELKTPVGESLVCLNAAGLHNLRNALAATACAVAAGVPFDAIVGGLERFNPVAGRMQFYPQQDGYQLIDDTYNANPDSVRAAIEVLAELAGRKVLVLGAMAEVGEQGPQMHAEVGRYAREQGIDVLLTLGAAAKDCAVAFGDGAHSFADIDALLSALSNLTPAHVLVKGSRSSKMERVVHAMKQKQSLNGGAHHVA